MTESFISTDYNGLKLLLLLSRLKAKAGIVADFTQHKFRLKEGVEEVERSRGAWKKKMEKKEEGKKERKKERKKEEGRR